MTTYFSFFERQSLYLLYTSYISILLYVNISLQKYEICVKISNDINSQSKTNGTGIQICSKNLGTKLLETITFVEVEKSLCF